MVTLRALRVFLGLLATLFMYVIGAHAQSCNTTMLPLIDATSCTSGTNKVIGDAVISPSATVNAATKTLAINSGGLSFTTADVGKALAISNMGLSASVLPAANITSNCGGSGHLPNGTYTVQAAQYAEASATVTSESYTSPERSVTIACGGTGEIVVAVPTTLTNAIGWNVYVGTATGQETLQPLVGSSFLPPPQTGTATCNNSLTTTLYGCPLTGTPSPTITVDRLQVNGPPPLHASQLAGPTFQATPITSTTGGGCSVPGNTTYRFKLAFITDLSSGVPNPIFTDVGRSASETSITVGTGSFCLVVKSPANFGSSNGGTGWIAYVSTLQATEVYQAAGGTGTAAVCNAASTGGLGCALTVGATLTISMIQNSTITPVQQFTTFQTQITGFTNSTTITFRDSILQPGSTPNGSAVWGTDNSLAFNSAIAASCPQSGNVSRTNKGCTIVFPGANNPTGSVTGRYYTSTSLIVPGENIVLAGGADSTTTTGIAGLLSPGGGASVAGGSASAARASAEIVCAGRTYCLTAGDTSGASATNGFEIRNLGFEDVSEANGPNTGGNAFGGLRLITVNNFFIERAYATNFSYGSCLDFEGFGTAGGTMQVGTILDSAGAGCLRGLNLSQGVSAINITNGNFQGNGIGSLAMDQGSIGANVGTAPGITRPSGSIRISGTQFRTSSRTQSSLTARTAQLGTRSTKISIFSP